MKLPISPLIDVQCNNDIKIIIKNTTHAFSSTAQLSGADNELNPIFGHETYINNKLISSGFGLPLLKFYKNTRPPIHFINNTEFTFNIHWHGLATTGYIDGVSDLLLFGKSTEIGRENTLYFPKNYRIINNQAFMWYHAHNMFISIQLIYGGLLGMFLVEDDMTKFLSHTFEYGRNHLCLKINDIDLDKRGVINFKKLTIDQNRSYFTCINGVCATDWFTENNNSSFVEKLQHKSHKNLIKIDMLNCNVNWRVYHIGVCDKKKNKKKFWVVQCDQGLLNPFKTSILSLYTAGRHSIIIDLDDFEYDVAHLFFYDYDLTEVFELEPNDEDDIASPLGGKIPNIDKPNNSPFPEDSDFHELETEPKTTNQILSAGIIVPPRESNIRVFLKLKLECQRDPFPFCQSNSISMNHIITKIRNCVFDIKNPLVLDTIQIDQFESKINYLNLLNSKYFYNVPTLEDYTPTRNFVLFTETDANTEKPNGLTESIKDANRIICDLWNSNELDLSMAIYEYYKNQNHFKPKILPTSRFTIHKTNDRYSNTAMISNDTLFIQIYDSILSYGDFTTDPIATVQVVFPSSDNSLNIQEWIDIINQTFSSTLIDIPQYPEYRNVSDMLSCDWSFFPYYISFVPKRSIVIKSAVIMTTNKTPFTIRFLGRIMLINFFGKSLIGQELNESYDTKYKHLYIPCNERQIYGILDADIQTIWPHYSTDDPSFQLPITCMRRNGELIIKPLSTFTGIYDSFKNNNLQVFNVKVNKTESWIYHNADAGDAHCLHFHLTSGFVIPQNNKQILLTDPSLPQFYSRDVYQIGGQQSIQFLLTFPEISSEDGNPVSHPFHHLGGVIHCHFLAHNDENGMYIQFGVQPSD